MKHTPATTTLLVIAITAVNLAPTAWAAQTIVGTWAPDPSDCTPVGGMVAIGPLSMAGDELSCRFDRVSRERDVISWQGRCSTGGLTAKPARVTAELRGITLALTIDGVPSGSFRRCRPR